MNTAKVAASEGFISRCDRSLRSPESLTAASGGLYVAAAMLTGLAVLGKAPLIREIVPAPAGVVYLLCAASCLMPLLYRQFLRVSRFLAVPIVLGVWLVALVVQYRLLSHLHSQGRGTDQGDCITVGAGQLFHGSWPYDRDLMWSHNPMSCGPGWLVAHAPSLVFGYPATMAALFTCAAVVVHLVHGFDTVAKFIVLLAITPGFWLSFANGNDFVTFGVMVVAVSALARTNRPVQRWVAAAGAVVLAQFRLPFALLPAVIPLDGPRAGQRGRYSRPLAAIACAVSLGTYGVFQWWQPDLMLTDGPFHVLEKSVNLVGFPGGRIAVIVAFVILTAIVAAISLRFHENYSALAYVTLTLVPLSAASLVSTIRAQHGVIDVLGHWEGVSWLTAVAAVAAGIVARNTRFSRNGIAPQGVQRAGDLLDR
ncbi:hypothetical protein P3H80_16500 [Mycolicibacterium septicum]|uniref:hypothetical protein n=1 Tax=Mycolicibacterium septicum TaxID=98668 RepID=UPI0023E25F80|nr:hypothetical protein [Mycolicibacterium septicum]MDF3339039.1 hypothetical protein [Mycolicibacterium septicum]